MTLRRGMAGIRKMSWAAALLAAALLGAGVAHADQCSDAWDDANAEDHCDDSDDSVTVKDIAGTEKCSVSIACNIAIDLLNGQGYESLAANAYVTNPWDWQVWENNADDQSANGLARTDVDDLTICFYADSLTDDTWVSWNEKLVVGSCGSGEVDVDDAVEDGLDMRVSELDK